MKLGFHWTILWRKNSARKRELTLLPENMLNNQKDGFQDGMWPLVISTGFIIDLKENILTGLSKCLTEVILMNAKLKPNHSQFTLLRHPCDLLSIASSSWSALEKWKCTKPKKDLLKKGTDTTLKNKCTIQLASSLQTTLDIFLGLEDPSMLTNKLQLLLQFNPDWQVTQREIWETRLNCVPWLKFNKVESLYDSL
jgi:hypothetical protein